MLIIYGSGQRDTKIVTTDSYSATKNTPWNRVSVKNINNLQTRGCSWKNSHFPGPKNAKLKFWPRIRNQRPKIPPGTHFRPKIRIFCAWNKCSFRASWRRASGWPKMSLILGPSYIWTILLPMNVPEGSRNTAKKTVPIRAVSQLFHFQGFFPAYLLDYMSLF